MAERPIKKSELPKRVNSEGQKDDLQGQKKQARKGRREKGQDHNDKKKPATPLALMRGPKPSAKIAAPEPIESTEERVEVPEDVGTEPEQGIAADATMESGADASPESQSDELS
ncbi:MAG: hypothetical protein HC851_21925 [Acaryochloris sp. RU_4_1]|nr:hypothetical protein [Acaryochloris sp. RU_4_1]NJR56720.1 hypothetical protein [Acaryochloris sp. CRU_2_0]